ncbi:hypothetical protein CKO42_23190 [Lamprobacter modestohalophilus]|uniref:Uncharacterized protein n=1 Tax=Lamprobacter modestohalophilus TaxID=1064514 RepID=A0A9X1B6A4_9GAMM|nr:hypothetical protein [Lamprobacter modestohalophilus]
MDLVIAAVSIAVLGSLIVAGILYGRQLHRQLLAVRAGLCEHFGLRDKAPGGSSLIWREMWTG